MELKINALADGNAEILLYGDIGNSWYDDVNPLDFANQLKECKADLLTIRINSNGGSLLAGNTIYNQIKSYTGKIKAVVDGIAASAASVIAMSCDLWMHKNSMLMIHNARTAIAGDSNQFQKITEVLIKANQQMVDVYHARTGLDKEKIQSMMDKETYLTAEEAVQMGFANGVIDDVEINARLDGDELLLNGVKFDAQIAKAFQTHHPNLELQAMAAPNINPATATPVANFLPKGATMLTIEALQKDHPDIYAKIFEAGKLSGVETGKQIGITAERQRIKDIEEMESSGHADLVAKAKFETGDSAGNLAVAILKAEKDQRSSLLAVNQSEADAVNKVVAAQLDPTAGIDPRAKAEEAFFAGVKDFAGVK